MQECTKTIRGKKKKKKKRRRDKEFAAAAGQHARNREEDKGFDLESLRSKLGEVWERAEEKREKSGISGQGTGGYRVQAAAHSTRVIAGAEKYLQASMRQIEFCVAAL